MATFKFVHCADLHLGSRAYGISGKDPELGKRMTEAVFKSFSKIIDHALLEKADFMVISGDIFDETTETPATRYRFSKELSRISIPVFICLGNHDYVMSWTESIPYPDNVHVFGKEPESIFIEVGGGNVEIVGRSFPSVHSSFDPVQDIKGKEGVFSVAVIHCSVDAVTMDNDYGPCKLADMYNKGIDYWALGHIHKRVELSKDPCIVYSGNIQGRNRRETGPKGAYLVSVSDNHMVGLEFFATQDVIWENIESDITGKDINGLMNTISSTVKKGSIINLTINGRGPLDSILRLGTEGLIDQIENITGCRVADLRINTYPLLERNDLLQGADLRAKIIRSSDKMSLLDRDQLINLICSTKQSASIRYMLEWLEDDELKALVRDAETLLIEKLTEGSR